MDLNIIEEIRTLIQVNIQSYLYKTETKKERKNVPEKIFIIIFGLQLWAFMHVRNILYKLLDMQVNYCTKL